MLLGPIFRVELVSVARRRRYFVLRVVYAALILLVLWSSYSSVLLWRADGQPRMSIQNVSTLATTFFVSFSWLQMLAILAVGPAMAAGTIAAERERRTIEYLFTTDLANHEIILGKTFARLFLLGQFVLVGLPILFLFRMLGGIPAQLLVATFLLAGSTAVLLTALGVCVSVWSPRARDAVVRVYLLLAAMFLLPIALQASMGWGVLSSPRWQAWLAPVVDGLIRINPLWALGKAMDRMAVGRGLDMPYVGQTAGAQLCVSLLAILLAMTAVRRVHLRASTQGAASKPSRYRSWRLPTWRRPLGERPLLWKEMYASTASTRLGIVGVVALTLILIVVLAYTLFFFWLASDDVLHGSQANDYHHYLYVITGLFGSSVLLLLGARSAGLITQEKERDCWWSLLATPLSGGEIIRGKMWGNLYAARWPFLLLLFIWGLAMVFTPSYGWTVLALSATFGLTAWFVTNLGLFFSLRSSTTLRSMGATLGVLVFLGGGYLLCCCTVMMGSSSNSIGLMFAPCLPFLLLFPAWAFVDWNSSNFWGREAFPVGYVCGVVGYLAASAFLYSQMVSRFDQLAGRCWGKPEEQTDPTKPEPTERPAE